jgi:hypothetical protein
MIPVIHGLPEMILQESTDIRSRASSTFKGGAPLEDTRSSVVQQIANILKAQVPGIVRCPSAIHDVISILLDGPIPRLSRILMRMVWLTLPIRDTIGTKDVLNFLGNLNLGSVTEESIHSSPSAYVILQCMEKIRVLLHAIPISEQRFAADKNLSYSSTIIHSRCIRVHSVSGNSFIAPMNIESREARLEVLAKTVGINGLPSELGSGSKSPLDDISRSKAKIRAQLIKVRGFTVLTAASMRRRRFWIRRWLMIRSGRKDLIVITRRRIVKVIDIMVLDGL